MRRTSSIEHSRLGIASFVISFGSVVLLSGLVLLARLFMSMGIDPPGDEVGYGFLVVMLVLGITLSTIVALVLGIAGTLQRRRTRSFAVLGIACSLLAFAVVYAGWFAQ